MASRWIFWNIERGEIVYLLGFMVVGLVCYALYRRLRLWGLGSKDDRLNNLGGRIRVFLATMADGLFHRRILRDRHGGPMHALIFGGFALLLMGPFLAFLSERVYP